MRAGRPEVRVAVYDDSGRLVELRVFPAHSYTSNFVNLLNASWFASPGMVGQPLTPAWPLFDVLGYMYYVGYGFPGAIGQLTQWMCLRGCPNLSPYSSYTINSPGIWAGYAQCASTINANGPCSPIPTSVLSPGPLNVPVAPLTGSPGWLFSVSQSLYNVSGATVTIASVALVAAAYATLSGGGILYAAMVDNVNPPLSLPPNYYITVTYTIAVPS